MTRREYPVRLTINGKQLSGSRFDPEAETGKFQYFVSDNLVVGQKRFRLVWLLEKDEIYIGVVNAHRRRK